MRTMIAAVATLVIPPCAVKNWLLRRLGWKIGANCRIGCSWIKAKYVRLANRSKVGHGNFLRIDGLVLADRAYLSHLNRVFGPLWVVLAEDAGIGNQNRIGRAKRGVTWGRAIFKLGVWSKLTSGHIVDCCRSVSMGDYTTIAGHGTQIWTHGYLHAPKGIERIRIDGRISIGNNVYIGSACVINAGVTISDAITVGAATCVSRSLREPGLYVSQPLRLIPLDYEEARSQHSLVKIDGLVDQVVNKRQEPRG